MPKRKRSLGLFLLIVLPVWVVIIFSFVRLRQAERESLYSERRALSVMMSSMISERFDHLTSLAKSLATRPMAVKFMEEGEWPAAMALYSNVRRDFPYLHRIVLLDTLGRTVGVQPASADPSDIPTEWKSELREERRALVSNVYLSTRIGGGAMFCIGMPVVDVEGNLLAFIIFEVQPDYWLPYTEKVDVGKSGSFFLVDRRGHVAFSPDFTKPDTLVNLSGIPVVRNALSGKNEVEAVEDLFGEPQLCAYQRVPAYGWGIVIHEPVHAGTPSATDIYPILFLLSAVTLSAGMAAYLIRYMVNREKMHDAAARASQQLMEQTETQYKSLFETAGVGHLVVNKEGEIIALNQRLAEKFGYTPEELKGKRLETLLPQNLVEKHKLLRQHYFHAPVRRSMEYSSELKGMRKDGTIIPVEVSLNYYHHGDELLVAALVIDVTKRKEAEDKATLNERYFKSLIENISDGVVLRDADDMVMYQSPSVARLLGAPMVTTPAAPEKFLHPDEIESFKAYHEKVRQHPGGSVNWRFRWRHANGHFIWVEGTTSNLLEEESVKAVVVTFRDVSDRIEAEQKAKESQRYFQGLIENSYDAIVVTDEAGKVSYQTPSVERILGYTVAERMDQSIMDFTMPEYQEALRKLWQRIIQSKGVPVPFQYVRRRKDGSEAWLEGTSTNLMHDPAIRGIVSNYRDITDRKRSEMQIAHSEANLRSVFEAVDDGLMMLDADARVILLNEGYQRFSNLLLGMNTQIGADAIGYADATETNIWTKALEKVRTQGRMTYEMGLGENESKTWFNVRISPVVDKNQTFVGYCIHIHDITSHHQSEAVLEASNSALHEKILQRSQQLERSNHELESFSYSVSHDLRAPLRIINGYSQMLFEDLKDSLPAQAAADLKVIVDNTVRMDHLITSLLSLSRLGRATLVKTRANMKTLVEDALSELERGGSNISVVKVGPLDPAIGDPSLLRQIWINLIANGIKYSSKSDHPMVEVGQMKKDDKRVYYVKDNGAGFDMKYYDKLFGIFQRLHRQEEFSGTGVGLATVQRIIRKHEGEIWAEAAVNQGATFYFWLPDDTTISGNRN